MGNPACVSSRPVRPGGDTLHPGDPEMMRRRVQVKHGAAMALSIVIVAASVWLALGEGDSADLAPLYLTIVVHNEEDVSRGVAPKASIPDYNGSPELMSHFADAMRAFAAMAADHRARINFGSDWTFSEGVRLYEPTFYIDLEALGHEVDAHAHQSSVLYREVREAVAAAGGNPTRVASGMEEATIQDQLEYFDHRAPEFEILWGVSLPGHGAGECTATWVWRPSRADWTLHDPDGRYVYVGHGELSIASMRSDKPSTAATRIGSTPAPCSSARGSSRRRSERKGSPIDGPRRPTRSTTGSSGSRGGTTSSRRSTCSSSAARWPTRR